MSLSSSSSRPKVLDKRGRSTSSESSTGSSCALPSKPVPPRTATASFGLVAMATQEPEGPIDVDSLEVWHEDAASVDDSLVMMNIEDPADSSGELKPETNNNTALDSAAQKWIQGGGGGGGASSSLSESINNESSNNRSPSPVLGSSGSILALEESLLWQTLDDSVSVDDEADVDEQQDVAPLDSFMQLEDYAEIRKYFDRFPILDEREAERVLCGYCKGFEPQPEPPAEVEPSASAETAQAAQVAFEI
jgi:hypothetical protein